MISAVLLCLSLNIYFEARGEPLEGQEAVAAITMNRSKDKDKPMSVCSVVYEPGAFSWTRHHMKVKDKESFDRAKNIAKDYLAGKRHKTIGNRKYFNERRLGKRFKTPHKSMRIGKLLYY